MQQLSIATARGIARRVATRLLPELDYDALSVHALMAQIWRVRVRCDTEGIQGWLSSQERRVLYALARTVPGPFAEVGSWVGLSTCIICAGIRDGGQQKEFVTHELNPTLDWFKPHGDGIGFFPPGVHGPFGVTSVDAYNRDIKPVLQRPGGAIGQLVRNLSSRGYGDMVRIEEGDFGATEARPYQFVFADVLHDAREIAENGPKLARIVGPGTVLACHDSDDEHETLLLDHIKFQKVCRLDSILVAIVR